MAGDVGTSELATRILALPALLRALAPTRNGVSVSLLCDELPKTNRILNEKKKSEQIPSESYHVNREISIFFFSFQTYDFYLAYAIVMESAVRPMLRDWFAMVFSVDSMADCWYSLHQHELVSPVYHLEWTFFLLLTYALL